MMFMVESKSNDFLSTMRRRFGYLFFLFCLFIVQDCFCSDGVWRVGLSGNVVVTGYKKDAGYAYDRKYYPGVGGGLGINAQYNFLDWLGLRFDFRLIQRNYTFKALIYEERCRYSQLYAILPVMISFSFGGKSVRGYCDIGGYVGYWLNGHIKYDLVPMLTGGDDYYTYRGKYDFDKRRDNRFDAGLSGALGIMYLHAKTGIFVNMELFAYYGLVNANKPTSGYFKQPAYFNNLGVGIGIGYVFKKKRQQQETIIKQSI